MPLVQWRLEVIVLLKETQLNELKEVIPRIRYWKEGKLIFL
jgi:hypothetical protein